MKDLYRQTASDLYCMTQSDLQQMGIIVGCCIVSYWIGKLSGWRLK